MNYKIHKLSNGLRVLTAPLSCESVTVTVWCRVGSRYEDEGIAGLSHFLEHMVFKGSKKRPTARDISQAVDAIGGEFNAGTSKEWTNFYIKTAKNNIETAFDVLSDMVINPLLKEEEIEREKGVILEEKAMYEDTPIMSVVDVFENLIFSGSTLGRDTIGTQEAIMKMSRKDFLDYRSIYYSSHNMLVTVAGAINEAKVLRLCEKYFSDLAREEDGKKHNKFKALQSEPRVRLKNKQIEQAHLVVGFLGNPLGHEDRFVESVLATILGGGMSSRLFIEVRERRGLAYSVRSSVEHYTDTGYISTYAGVDPRKAKEAIEVILNEHFKIADSIREKITAEELRKAKEYVKGHLALSLENTSFVNDFFGEQELLLNKVLTPEEVNRGIDGVTIDDVVRVARRLFTKSGLNLAVIGPYNSAEKFQKALWDEK